uniref:Hydrogenase maturation protease n=1 Tax=Candidatus Methanomethylicus mesodigestus TaxID=1867258 RepID=A0A7C3F2M2_9CREN
MPFEDEVDAFLSGWRKLSLVGVGNELRRDDAAGMAVVRAIERASPKGVLTIIAGPVPENFSGSIKRAQPSHILFFDAVEMGATPGEFSLIREGDLAINALSTHKQSVKVLFMVLREGIPGVRIALVGIQPKTVDFGRGVSRPVSRGVKRLAVSILDVIGRTGGGSDGAKKDD